MFSFLVSSHLTVVCELVSWGTGVSCGRNYRRADTSPLGITQLFTTAFPMFGVLPVIKLIEYLLNLLQLSVLVPDGYSRGGGGFHLP
jgi:hypothetical protein